MLAVELRLQFSVEYFVMGAGLVGHVKTTGMSIPLVKSSTHLINREQFILSSIINMVLIKQWSQNFWLCGHQLNISVGSVEISLIRFTFRF